jgi:hypothetical protein
MSVIIGLRRLIIGIGAPGAGVLPTTRVNCRAAGVETLGSYVLQLHSIAAAVQVGPF